MVGVDLDATQDRLPGSVRLVLALGPAGAAALALFSSPRADKAHPIAINVAPMFAARGAGLELRGA